MYKQRRVVITGLGAITPLGNSVAAYWQALLAGRSGIGYYTRFDASGYPTRIGGEVRDFAPESYMTAKEVSRSSRVTHFAIASATDAWRDACLPAVLDEPEDYGVLLGVGNVSFPETEVAARTLFERGGQRVSPHYVPASLPNMPAAAVATRFGLRGYLSTVAAACATGNVAIGEAAHVIRRGDAAVMLTGGYEAAICLLGQAAFNALHAMSQRNDEPEAASRPFDRERDGFVAGEGGATLVLEEMEHAVARGARIYAEVLGYGATADAYHPVAPRPDGAGAAAAMRRALKSAGVAPEEVDYINAHGTSTVLNDVSETNAIKLVFGALAQRIPISATKSMLGHLLSAAGAVEAVASVMTICDGVIHPTINYHTPDPACDLDYVPNVARRQRVRTVLSNSFGFGGQNACLVLRAWD